MRIDKLFNAGAFLLIAGLGLATAWICFGVLNSQAKGNYEGYSLGGSVVGAIVSWGFLTTIYLKVQKSSNELDDLRKKSSNELEDLRKKSSNELEDLRKQNKTLEDKLILGAPHPQGFDLEVDERQRIVLARPKDWEPKGGIIFELELPDKKMKPNDTFAAMFRCYFVPIEKDSNETREQFQRKHLNLVKDATTNGYFQSYSNEVMRIGGEVEAVESLKYIAHQVVRTEIEKSKETGREKRVWSPVLWKEFVGRIDQLEPEQVTVGDRAKITLFGADFRNNAVCYVNKKKRKTRVVNAWQAEVTLADEDVDRPRVLELVIENPDTKGKQSNGWTVLVTTEPQDKQTATEATAGESGEQLDAGIPAAEDSKKAVPSAPSEYTDGEGGTLVDASKTEEPRVVFQEIISMTVICYHEELKKIFYFEFFDDEEDFLESSHEFNLILASTRFLS